MTSNGDGFWCPCHATGDEDDVAGGSNVVGGDEDEAHATHDHTVVGLRLVL